MKTEIRKEKDMTEWKTHLSLLLVCLSYFLSYVGNSIHKYSAHLLMYSIHMNILLLVGEWFCLCMKMEAIFDR